SGSSPARTCRSAASVRLQRPSSSSLARSRSAAFSCEPRGEHLHRLDDRHHRDDHDDRHKACSCESKPFHVQFPPWQSPCTLPSTGGCNPLSLACLLPPDPTAHEVLLEEGDCTTRQLEAVRQPLDA